MTIWVVRIRPPISCSSDGSTGLIVGGGYYEETEPKLDKLLKSCVADYGIVSGELGANYSDDHGVFETIFERLDDAFSQGRKSLLSPVEMALWQDLPSHFDAHDLPTQFPNVIGHIPN